MRVGRGVILTKRVHRTLQNVSLARGYNIIGLMILPKNLRSYILYCLYVIRSFPPAML